MLPDFVLKFMRRTSFPVQAEKTFELVQVDALAGLGFFKIPYFVGVSAFVIVSRFAVSVFITLDDCAEATGLVLRPKCHSQHYLSGYLPPVACVFLVVFVVQVWW